jgi:hypothetical protein
LAFGFSISNALKLVALALSEIGLSATSRIQNPWTKATADDVTNHFAPELAAHGAGLNRVLE